MFVVGSKQHERAKRSLIADTQMRMKELRKIAEDSNFCRDALISQIKSDCQSASVRRDEPFLVNFVQQVLSQLVAPEYEQFIFANGTAVQATGDIVEGIDTFAWGAVEHYVGNSDDLSSWIIEPSVGDVEMVESNVVYQVEQTYVVGGGFEITDQELARAQVQGNFNIAREKANAATLQHDGRMDRWLAFGEPKKGIYGMLNAPGIPLEINTLGKWDRTNASATLNRDIQEYFAVVLQELRQRTELTGNVDSCILPDRVMSYLSTAIFDSAAGTASLLDVIRSQHPQITMWESSLRMDNLGGEGVDSMILYNRSTDTMEGHYSYLRRTLPPERRGLKRRVINISGLGPVTVKRPYNALIVQDI